jgi:hypothetical protein
VTRDELKQIIVDAYEINTTMMAAEKYAALFLSAQMEVSEQLRSSELDRRMRKRGLKAIKSAVRTEAIKSSSDGRKPTEGVLEDIVNLSSLVASQEEEFDTSEVNSEALERDYNIFREAHLYFRTISKGTFGG